MSAETFWKQSKFKIVEDCVDKLGDIADGSIVPQQGTIDDDAYEEVRNLAIPSSVPLNIVETRYKKVVSGTIERDRNVDVTATEYYDALDKDTDATGTPRTIFIGNALKSVASNDFSYMVMDDVAVDKKTSNADLNIKTRAFPFFTIVQPQSINEPLMRYNDRDRLIQFAYDYKYTNEKGEETTRTKIINEKIIEIKEGNELISITPIDISLYNGYIPVKIIKGNETAPNSQLQKTTPSMYGVCKTVINIMILDAGLDFSLNKGNFSQMVYPCTDKRRKEIFDDPSKFKAGQLGVLFEDSAQSNTSRFITPEVGNAEAISSRKKDKFEQIYREEGLRYSQGATVQSGDSKLMDSQENNSNLEFMSNLAIDVDKWMDTMFAGHLDFDYDPNEASYGYPTEFGIDDILSQIEELTMFLEAGGASISVAKKESLKAMAVKLFTDKALEDVAKAIDEENMEADPVEPSTTF